MLVWGGEPVGGGQGPWLDETPDGAPMGWASMETRLQVRRLPVAGDRIQSFGAGVAVHDKVTHRVHWTYDLDRGDLLTAFESVSMAFDIRARRPVSIPDAIRRRELAGLQPDLAAAGVTGDRHPGRVADRRRLSPASGRRRRRGSRRCSPRRRSG